MGEETERIDPLLEMTGEIVGAYLGNNPVSPSDVPSLIGDVHATLRKLQNPAAEVVRIPQPAVSPKISVTPDYIVCLEDGKKFKSLKRHLMSRYGMTPEDYRKKWGLAGDYPMVAPNYAAVRSRLAKDMGLGRKRDVDDLQAA